MKRKKKFTLPGKYILLILTIICVAAAITTYVTNSSVAPLKFISGYTIIPVQNGINNIGMWFSNKADSFKQLQEVMEENVDLKEQVDELSIENNTLQQDKYELDRLRELYELDQKYPSYKKVAARITGKDPGNWFSTFIIDKGTKDGLAVDMNVIAGSGLVGIISDVGPNWATVRAIIDDSSNVSSMVLSTSDTCMVMGDLQLMNEGQIRFRQLNDTNGLVVVGDKVVTSHISSKFLQGILIGYISEITMDANNITKSGYITPVVDFQHLEEVLVITDLKEQQQ
ncbi:rod shape-determining protein MreC [Anaerobium acetethylicum]|uniref:Cell shape-determining protein MreC n=1 Tax=Anaerobium acetethylicum TaxID=1619234 RepID=A0A1D3TNV9_9FIRM|nr:rod shape-determining protein MreC [Anaerobium acetethylicum]SCP95039.1 rod shape-determining protein MreC [Anaerobium acetethylicum]